jgi:hypothetical protein
MVASSVDSVKRKPVKIFPLISKYYRNKGPFETSSYTKTDAMFIPSFRLLDLKKTSFSAHLVSLRHALGVQSRAARD